ncbi:protein CHROMATIN REMODELING 35-like isoform X3 [Phoenix dactylifera]|uniref:Protein CHROMATIN REMODELING 35-like isoform X3 n=1 Tax=Phoenix dactylifera TaxID=42345 RepID=A0A8B8ZFE9_PHODC|nr:protein CHROMATIN REMODELING 35-like isoform X3 [Phoenix dactylifera]
MMPDCRQYMYRQRHKRTKLDNEDNNYRYKSEVTALCSSFEKTKEKSTSKVRDYSNPLALSNLLESLDDGIYGSVTKEYETLHAQRMQVIKFLSTLQPSLANSYPSLLSSSHCGINTWSDLSTRGNQNSDQRVDSSISSDIIDLEADSIGAAANTSMRMSAEKTPESSVQNILYCGEVHRKMPDVANGPSDSCPKYKEGKDNTSVIILDSDDEDAIHQTGSQHASHSGRKYSDLRTLIGTRIESLQRQAMITQENHLNQIIPYDYGSNKLDGSVAFRANWQPSVQYQKVVLQKVPEKQRFQDLVNQDYAEKRGERQGGKALAFEMTMEEKTDVNSMLGSYAAVQEHSSVMGICQQEEAENLENDEHQLDDLWKEMSLAMECSKSPKYDEPAAVQEEEEEECKHSPVLQDDLGIVCRICGVIQRSIDTIFEYQWAKAPRAARTLMSRSRNTNDVDETLQYSGPKFLEHFIAADVSIHPRHLKQMKPHQLEGFNFLVRNLVNDKPGGCILAHAPGSGKTFMLISFVQSFLAKYPFARPLVVLPKGILPIWKKEFQRWQVEDIPLYDFYSSKADNRSQQLEILHSWQENNSILFLGYKQFTNIICDNDTSKIASACRESLLKVPTLLILDEGHTPRNENTYVLDSLAKVQTHRKVVLSGTLFQNHVREVFTILNLVRPKFLRLDTSRDAVNRILSRVNISCKRLSKSSKERFYDLVEETLQNDDNFKRKVRVIQDLREMTKDVLHYYKGDFLDELPGVVDFTVLLKLSARQKTIVQTLEKFEKFKKCSVGSAVYIHPHLLDISESTAGDRVYCNDEKIDGLLDSVNVRDGVKTKFFLNILSLSESVGEKVLAFSQYILPLKFLERLLVKMKGWHSGKEIFMITGDSSPEQRELSMEQFNNSPDAKVFLGSIKACGEGISLVGASRVVILDVHLNPSVTRQAIGRVFRPGQEKKVYTYRLVAADSPEEEDHKTSFRKELISKMWFEWSEYCDHRDFELDEIDIASCQDMFLESSILGEDVKVLYRR